MGGCLNKALEYLSISERTCFQNANVLCIMVVSQLLGLELLTQLRLLAGLLLATGGILQAMGSREQNAEASEFAQAVHLKGMVFMVISMLLTAVKWAMIQLMTQRQPKSS